MKLEYKKYECERGGCGDAHVYFRVNNGEKQGPFLTVVAAFTMLFNIVKSNLEQEIVESAIEAGKDVLEWLPLANEEHPRSPAEIRDEFQKEFPCLRGTIEEIFAKTVAKQKAADEFIFYAFEPDRKILRVAS